MTTARLASGPIADTVRRCTASSASPSASTSAACDSSSLRVARNCIARPRMPGAGGLSNATKAGTTAAAIDSAASSARCRRSGGTESSPSVNAPNAGFPSRAKRASTSDRARSKVVLVAATAARRNGTACETRARARSAAL